MKSSTIGPHLVAVFLGAVLVVSACAGSASSQAQTLSEQPAPTQVAAETATPEPEPTATPEPEPTATSEPEPTATPEPEPTATPEPEPTATAEPEPTATSEPAADDEGEEDPEAAGGEEPAPDSDAPDPDDTDPDDTDPDSDTGEPADTEEAADATGAIDGAAIFSGSCASCHGANGEGSEDGPSIVGIGQFFVSDASPLLGLVTNGGNNMPAFADKLSADEIDAVVQYVVETYQ